MKYTSQLQIATNPAAKGSYIASYKGEEALNLAYNGTYCDAVNEALILWGLNIDDVSVVVLDELENFQFFNSENINQEHGFFHIEFNNEKSLQCCLVQSKKIVNRYNKQIDSHDTGVREGLSSDCNEWFGDDIEIIENVILTAAKKYGVKIIA